MGVTSSKNPYHNDYSSIIAVDAVTAAVAAICVGLRFYVRRVLQREKPGMDDWLLLAGLTMFIISNSFDIAAWVRRDSEGFRDGDPGHLFEMIDIVFYILAEILVRAAYTAFYLRIVPLVLGLSRDRYAMLTILGLYAAFQIPAAFMFLFQCGSPAVANDDNASTAKCISHVVMSSLFQAIYYFDCIFDCMMVLVPMRVVWSSTLSRRDRTGAFAVLSLGCSASALAVTIIILAHKKRYSEVNVADMHLSIQMDKAATCEVFVAIVCLCLATYKPLFRRFFDVGSGDAGQPTQSWVIPTTPGSPDLDSLGVVEYGESTIAFPPTLALEASKTKCISLNISEIVPT